jgi:hypothetical protein
MTLHAADDGDDEDPRREQDTHHDPLFDVATRPGIDPAATLVICRYFGATTYALMLTA